MKKQESQGVEKEQRWAVLTGLHQIAEGPNGRPWTTEPGADLMAQSLSVVTCAYRSRFNVIADSSFFIPTATLANGRPKEVLCGVCDETHELLSLLEAGERSMAPTERGGGDILCIDFDRLLGHAISWLRDSVWRRKAS